MNQNFKDSDLFSSSDVEDASKRIYEICRRTPLEFSHSLSKIFDSNIYLKCEFQQYTGSFKLRGASNKILKIFEKSKEKHIQINNKINLVTASTGNHGSAVSFATYKLKEKMSDKNCVNFYSKQDIDIKSLTYSATIFNYKFNNSTICRVNIFYSQCR